MLQLLEAREYNRERSAGFLKTNDDLGGLSNMAGGFPLCVNGIKILTSEALYQACRFPHLPDVQRVIVSQRSPMTAKMKSKPYRKDSRPDWERVRIQVMRWCLQIKLAQNWEKFGNLLLSTNDLPIVEESYRDTFWGAKPVGTDKLVGTNILGRLLVELREQLRTSNGSSLQTVEPLRISNFLLYGEEITTNTGLSSPELAFSSSVTQTANASSYYASSILKQEVQSKCDRHPADQIYTNLNKNVIGIRFVQPPLPGFEIEM